MSNNFVTITGKAMDMTSPEFEAHIASQRTSPGERAAREMEFQEREKALAAREAAIPRTSGAWPVLAEKTPAVMQHVPTSKRQIALDLVLRAFDGDVVAAIEALMENL